MVRKTGVFLITLVGIPGQDISNLVGNLPATKKNYTCRKISIETDIKAVIDECLKVLEKLEIRNKMKRSFEHLDTFTKRTGGQMS